ncbi:hypothetical protein QYE76_033053 [Lolium multiflorum]|uniref:ADP-ribosylation factor n=1 Tax=Lolium multiflorum TaxID=4521 RepID=A0AAD8VLR8_LOLMU|nr:hypothetical protein QYE76_033053 [Lolium multiflorum]
MFSLFYGLWNHVFSKTEFRVLILGVHKAGKTTLLEKLKSIYLKGEGLPHDRVVPTPGLRTIWEKYYDEAHAIVYVIDSASASTFEDTKSALEKALRHEDLQEAPLLIFANKQDLPAAVTEEELDRHLHLKEFDERPYMFVAGSAYDGLFCSWPSALLASQPGFSSLANKDSGRPVKLERSGRYVA